MRWLPLLALPLIVAAPVGQQQSSPAAPNAEAALCRANVLPLGVQILLKAQFPSWKIQEPENLSERARESWEGDKPAACPGIATGRFQSSTETSHALLLVPIARPDDGYRFVVFSREVALAQYSVNLIEQRDGAGASNYYVHEVRTDDFFSHKGSLKPEAPEAILFVASAENEYEANVYFWANGRYDHSWVDR